MRWALLLILGAIPAPAQNTAEPMYQLPGGKYEDEAPAIQKMLYDVAGEVQYLKTLVSTGTSAAAAVTGQAMLIATQTFSGTNTFGPVTVSSLSVTGYQSGWQPLSNGNISASSSTVILTGIVADTEYEVSFSLTQNTTTGNAVIHFNHAGGTPCYSAIVYGNSSSVLSVAAYSPSDFVYITAGTDTVGVGGSLQGKFRFRTLRGNSSGVQVYGIDTQFEGNTYPSIFTNGGGRCIASSAIANLEFLTDAGTLTGHYSIRKFNE